MAGFKARARALDMLGRQQIAGVPTAISELFKNAHDAYADNVIVDYFRSDKLFVLRDDGYGMTRNDFEDKWLTLGTESKFVSTIDKTLPEVTDKSRRPVMGEKGIGRLAIASLGDHVLILTRAARKDGLHDLVMSFVYWRLFEIPGINLDQVVIPIKEISGGQLPDENDFNELCLEIENNIDSLYRQGYISDQEQTDLKKPLSSIHLAANKIDKYVSGPSLSGIGHGTWFIISPANELIEASIDGKYDDTDGAKSRETPIKEMLLGFCNTMFLPNGKGPIIHTSFRDHKSDEYYDDLINDKEFWTINDYEKADQRIKGAIDEYGQFKGEVTVYGKTYNNHIINWKGNNGVKTQCGPFNIQFGYIQGNPSDTMLSPDNFALMTSKLEKISGLYLYRDDIRILPYGDSAHDYLKLEERRNKGNAYYFFSYRRMFGAISITRQDNPNLTEKAGREGLRENMAYKQFISILQNLFIQLAADFFRDSNKYPAGPNADFFIRQKDLLMKKYKAQKIYEASAKAKKDTFQKSLNALFEKINANTYKDQIESIFNQLNRDMDICNSISDPDEASSFFIRLEQKARASLDGVVAEYTLKQPRGFQPGKRTMQDYETYLSWYEKATEEVFNPASAKLDDAIANYQQSMKFNISRRKRLEVAVDDTISRCQKETKSETSEVQKAVKNITEEVISVSNSYLAEYDAKIRQIQDELSKIDPYSLDDSTLIRERTRMEEELMTSADAINSKIANIKRQLDSITLDGDASNMDALDLYAEEVESLRAQLNADLELSQLGLAVSAIQHEFQHTVDNIKHQIKKFKAWADVNDGLKSIYSSFRVNFEHLDSYLGLFAPLNRRLYREEVEIYGNDTYKFVKDVFYSRISENRHNIALDCSKAFAQNTITGYPSTFYPVFVNIVDNAIFWLKDANLEEKKIYMDADSNGNMYISNNGPSIDIRDWERIFENGFSKKPSGRGMGLYLSREVLQRSGYNIKVIEPREGYNVSFMIFKEEK